MPLNNGQTFAGYTIIRPLGDRYRLGEFGICESDGAPDEKERRPKHQPPGYQACMMAR